MNGPVDEERTEVYNLFGDEYPSFSGELRVKKSNGHIEVFSLKKLTSSIKNAFTVSGEENPDIAYSLAVAIKNYLRSTYGAGSIIKSEELCEITLDILEEMGYRKALEAYIEYERFKKLKATIEERIREELIEKKGRSEEIINYDDLIFIRSNRIVGILSELCESSDLVLNDVEIKKVLKKVVDCLRNIIGESKTTPSPSFIRELCALVLISEGYKLKTTGKFIALDMEKVLEIIADGKKETLPNPMVSTIAIGEEVKTLLSRECVFSKRVIEAGKKGKISLLHTPYFDRLGSISIPIYNVWKMMKDKEKSIESPDDFLEYLLKVSAEISEFFSDYVEWWGTNLFLAPLLKGFEGNEYKDWLLKVNKVLCSNRSLFGHDVYFTIDWDIPESVASLPALGNRGKELGTGYTNYLANAREHFFDFLSIFAFHQREVNSTSHLVWRFDSKTASFPSMVVWSLVLSVVNCGKVPLSFRVLPFSKLEISPQLSLYKITIDLVNLYLISGTEQGFFSEFYYTMLTVVQAFEEYLCFLYGCKKTFGTTAWEKMLSRVSGKENGSFAFETLPFTVSLAGISECASLLIKDRRVTHIECIEKTNYILERLKQIIESVNKEKGLNIKVKLESDSTILKNMFSKTRSIYPNLPDYEYGILSSKSNYDGNIVYLGITDLYESAPLFTKFLQLTKHLDYPAKIKLYTNTSIDGKVLTEIMNYIFKETGKNARQEDGDRISFDMTLISPGILHVDVEDKIF